MLPVVIVVKLMCSSICLFYYSFLFHIRFHVGQDGHGAHEHVQRAAAHAQLHHGQQPAYASECSATPGHHIPLGFSGPWAVWECGWGPSLCAMRDYTPKPCYRGTGPQRLPWHLKRCPVWGDQKGKGAERCGAQRALFPDFKREKSSNLQGNKSRIKKCCLGKKNVVNLWNSLMPYCGNCCLNKLLEGSDLLGVGNVAEAH